MFGSVYVESDPGSYPTTKTALPQQPMSEADRVEGSTSRRYATGVFRLSAGGKAIARSLEGDIYLPGFINILSYSSSHLILSLYPLSFLSIGVSPPEDFSNTPIFSTPDHH